MKNYLGQNDNSLIVLEAFNNISSIPYVVSDLGRYRVPTHQHHNYELVLVTRGACRHTFLGYEVVLIPGDFLLIPPEEPHAYELSENIAICNCRFDAASLYSEDSIKYLKDITFTAMQRKSHLGRYAEQSCGNTPSSKYSGDINGQGIVHLDSAQLKHIRSLLEAIHKEQIEQKLGDLRMQQLILEYLLIEIRRIQDKQFEETHSNWQENMLKQVLNQIENNIETNFDFKKIAKEHCVSPSYFRAIFKETTGLSPVKYLNRVRIMRALELLETEKYTVSEISVMVGFEDTNYFSRLFKKEMGYPPSRCSI